MPWEQGSPALPAAEPSRQALLDRLHSHTERCPDCSAALRALRTARSTGLVAAAVATAAAAWLSGASVGGASVPVLAAVVGVVGVLLAAAAHGVEPSFVYKHHSHAEQD